MVGPTRAHWRTRRPTKTGWRPAEAGATARELAVQVADAADADQWAIAVVGAPDAGKADFEELVPRRLLEALSPRASCYRLTLVLQGAGRDLAVLRLGTVRPSGFSDLDVARARAAARQAGEALARTLFWGGESA